MHFHDVFNMPVSPFIFEFFDDRDCAFCTFVSELRIFALHTTYTQYRIHSIFIFMGINEFMNKQMVCEQSTYL